MNIDAFWEDIFSEEPARIRDTFRPLDKDERASVFGLLLRIDADSERIEAQHAAARVAMLAIRTDPAALPAGALDFANQVTRDTGLHLKLTFGTSQASIKGDGTLVTEADLDSDRRISAAIAAHYPEHAILSEERQKIYNGEEWAWVLDPIDGTTNFAWGFPCWGVLLALLHFGQPVLGVSDFPMLEEHYDAIVGGGARMNGLAIHAIDLPRNADGSPGLHPTQIFATCSRAVERGALKVGAKLRISGSCGYDMALLASGCVVGTLQQRAYPWDVAAGWILAEEAGAKITELDHKVIFPLAPGVDCGATRCSLLGAASAEFTTVFQKGLLG
jgi:myo-inositol-1(or 4)-monophosphatase